MTMPIDIFRLEDDTSLLWMEATDSIKTAQSRVADFIQKTPADYLIVSQATGEEIVMKRDEGCLV